MIYNINYEKQVIAGLLQHPKIQVEIGSFLSENDFSKIHRALFNVLNNLILERGTANQVILLERLKALNISIPELDIGQYLDALTNISITESGAIEVAKDLAKVTIRREFAEAGKNLIEEMKQDSFESAEDIVTTADQIYNRKVNLYNNDQRIINICEELDSLMAAQEDSAIGELACPYPSVSKYYGGFLPGNVYCFASRSGQGKSTLLNDIAFKTANISNKGVKVLYLDTEMQTMEVWPRMLASISGVPEYHIKTKKYKQNAEMTKKVNAAIDFFKKDNNFHHKYVGRMPLRALISLIKRWYLTECGRGQRALIIYDYLKILEADRNNGQMKEYEMIGDKMNALKECATELNAPLLTAVQINRSGVNSNKQSSEVQDDESVIAQSDRITWFASYIGIFRRKTPDEIQEDGIVRGTHKLITLKTRFQGEYAVGHHDLVKVFAPGEKKPKYVTNYINFSVDNFAVTERGCLRDYVNRDIELERVNKLDTVPL